MAKVHHRVFALGGALLFLFSTVAVSLLIAFSVNKEKKAAELSNQPGSELNADELLKNAKQSQEGQLEGTKLQNFSPIASVDSLQKIDLVPGTGAEVKAGDTVTAHYTGALVKDGTIFQSSHDRGQPIPFSLNEVIPGWQQGVPGMKVGGTRRLIIPAELAYGPNGSPPAIGPNEALVFDIELVKIGE